MTPQTFPSSTSSRRAPASWASRCWWKCTPTTASRSRSRARVDWVYDFALPPLVLHALFFGTPSRTCGAGSGAAGQCADRARHARRHRHHRHRRRRNRPRRPPGPGAPGATRPAGGAHPRQQPRPEPRGHRRRGRRTWTCTR
jgi:hypothetical protein